MGSLRLDLFASAYHMTITDRKEAKNISAAVLEGKQIGVFSDLPIKKLPDGFVMDRWCEENICITVKDPSFRKKKLLICVFIHHKCVYIVWIYIRI